MSLCDIQIRFPKVMTNPPDVWEETREVLAATLQTNRGMLFMNEGKGNGHPGWAPLSYRKGQPLLKRGHLSQSMAPANSGVVPGKGPKSILRYSSGVVTIGTALPYAAMMNWGTEGLPGGVLRPKNAKALRFKIGRKVIFCKSVKIPARRFDTFTKEDVTEFEETIANTIEELFR